MTDHPGFVAQRAPQAPVVKSFVGSMKDDRCLEVWFADVVTDHTRAWLLEAINEKALSQGGSSDHIKGRGPSWQTVVEAIKRRLHISSDHDFRPWSEIEKSIRSPIAIAEVYAAARTQGGSSDQAWQAVRDTGADEWGSHVCYADSFGVRSCGKNNPDLNCRCADIAKAVVSVHGTSVQVERPPTVEQLELIIRIEFVSDPAATRRAAERVWTYLEARAKTLARQTTTSVLPRSEGQAAECDGGLRTFDIARTILRRSGNVFTITCEDEGVANRVADQLRTEASAPIKGDGNHG